MDQYYLPLFLFNIVMILVDASLGYHFAPRLMSGIGEPESVEISVRTTRRMLPVVVALYMFFNCFGYFQGRLNYLLAVSGLGLIDLALQLILRRTMRNGDQDEE